MSSVQRRTLAWPILSVICLSNICSMFSGSAVAAVDAGQRDGPAAADDLDRRVQRAEAVDARRLHDLARDGVGEEAGEGVRELAARRAVRLHADRVDHRVGAAAAGELAHGAGDVVARRRRRWSATPCAGERARRSGTRSRPMTVPAPRCWAIRQAISPIGPRPITASAAAVGDRRRTRRPARRWAARRRGTGSGRRAAPRAP